MHIAISRLNPLRGRDAGYDAVVEDFETKRRRLQEEHEARLAALDAEEADAKHKAMAEAKAADPEFQRLQEQARIQHEAGERAARRLAALRELADERLAKHEPSAAALQHARSDLAREQAQDFLRRPAP